MKEMVNRTIVAGMFALLALGTAASGEVGAQAHDLTGSWIFTVTVEGDVTTPVVVLEQTGAELSGRYSSDALGQQTLAGRVEENRFTFSFQAVLEGQPVPVTYSGVIEDAQTLTGSLDLAGFLNGTFRARPRPEEPQ